MYNHFHHSNQYPVRLTQHNMNDIQYRHPYKMKSMNWSQRNMVSQHEPPALSNLPPPPPPPPSSGLYHPANERTPYPNSEAMPYPHYSDLRPTPHQWSNMSRYMNQFSSRVSKPMQKPHKLHRQHYSNELSKNTLSFGANSNTQVLEKQRRAHTHSEPKENFQASTFNTWNAPSANSVSEHGNTFHTDDLHLDDFAVNKMNADDFYSSTLPNYQSSAETQNSFLVNSDTKTSNQYSSASQSTGSYPVVPFSSEKPLSAQSSSSSIAKNAHSSEPISQAKLVPSPTSSPSDPLHNTLMHTTSRPQKTPDDYSWNSRVYSLEDEDFVTAPVALSSSDQNENDCYNFWKTKIQYRNTNEEIPILIFKLSSLDFQYRSQQLYEFVHIFLPQYVFQLREQFSLPSDTIPGTDLARSSFMIEVYMRQSQLDSESLRLLFDTFFQLNLLPIGLHLGSNPNLGPEGMRAISAFIQNSHLPLRWLSYSKSEANDESIRQLLDNLLVREDLYNRNYYASHDVAPLWLDFGSNFSDMIFTYLDSIKPNLYCRASNRLTCGLNRCGYSEILFHIPKALNQGDFNDNSNNTSANSNNNSSTTSIKRPYSALANTPSPLQRKDFFLGNAFRNVDYCGSPVPSEALSEIVSEDGLDADDEKQELADINPSRESDATIFPTTNDVNVNFTSAYSSLEHPSELAVNLLHNIENNLIDPNVSQPPNLFQLTSVKSLEISQMSQNAVAGKSGQDAVPSIKQLSVKTDNSVQPITITFSADQTTSPPLSEYQQMYLSVIQDCFVRLSLYAIQHDLMPIELLQDICHLFIEGATMDSLKVPFLWKLQSVESLAKNVIHKNAMLDTEAPTKQKQRRSAHSKAETATQHEYGLASSTSNSVPGIPSSTSDTALLDHASQRGFNQLTVSFNKKSSSHLWYPTSNEIATGNMNDRLPYSNKSQTHLNRKTGQSKADSTRAQYDINSEVLDVDLSKKTQKRSSKRGYNVANKDLVLIDDSVQDIEEGEIS